MAIVMRGLRIKPSYEDSIGVAKPDELKRIKIPNRNAKFLREGFVLSQFDGEGARPMQLQQEQAMNEPFEEHMSKQIGIYTSSNLLDSSNGSEADYRK